MKPYTEQSAAAGKPVEQLINDNTLVALALLVAEKLAGSKRIDDSPG